MTPDAVIYRYLELISSSPVDSALFSRLLAADADLLARWLRLLDIPADAGALENAIDTLPEAEFTSLAEAQAWSVLPIVGSARLSLDQWMGVLRAAYLAEVLTDHVRETQAQALDARNMRMRALLAISGVQLKQDVWLSQLNEFRGINPVLLEDAGIDLRIFAVVDALEIGRETELANQLLGIQPDEFDDLLRTAGEHARQYVSTLGIDVASDTDWAHLIWMRQQVSVVTAGLKSCPDWDAFHDIHKLVSRSLFDRVPLVLRQEEADAALTLIGNGGVAVSINPASSTSSVAAASRTGELLSLRDSADLAVVDRQLLRRLDAEEALVLRVPDTEPAVMLIVASLEDVDTEVLATLYAQALTRPIALLRAGITGDDAGDDDTLLEQFRTAEAKRLREIVHEANNPLSIVHNYLHILQLRLQHETEAFEQLTLISDELRRAAGVFASARDIPNQLQVKTTEPGEITEIDARRWLQQIAQLHSGYAAEQNVPLNSQLPEPTVLFKSQQDKLTQIVTNLLKNALEACQPGDDVVLGYRGGVYRNGRLGLEIYVADSGPGLSTEVLANLSGPKQSTKGGDHQGVGLQLAFGLAEEVEGALDVRTQSGQGTTFTLYVPLAPGV